MSQAERILENATAQHALNKSLLKLTQILDNGAQIIDLSAVDPR